MMRFVSYFEIRGMREVKGKVLSISNSELDGVKVDGKVECLIPSWELVRQYKYKGLSEEEFVNEYRDELKRKWKEVKSWLMSLDKDEDYWLCCWEREGEFCHRRLVYRMVRKWREDLKVELR